MQIVADPVANDISVQMAAVAAVEQWAEISRKVLE